MKREVSDKTILDEFVIYEGKINEEKINKIKQSIRIMRLNKNER
ncbi:MAG TPA: hypothetical protein VJH65_02715 [Candidatus Nanoarchaeia archaeon]|nr:hypothetical protein [Candidatus Nanoarchaeia archaeon]